MPSPPPPDDAGWAPRLARQPCHRSGRRRIERSLSRTTHPETTQPPQHGWSTERTTDERTSPNTTLRRHEGEQATRGFGPSTTASTKTSSPSISPAVFVTPGGTATKRLSDSETKDPNYKVRGVAVNREVALRYKKFSLVFEIPSTSQLRPSPAGEAPQ